MQCRTSAKTLAPLSGCPVVRMDDARMTTPHLSVGQFVSLSVGRFGPAGLAGPAGPATIWASSRASRSGHSSPPPPSQMPPSGPPALLEQLASPAQPGRPRRGRYGRDRARPSQKPRREAAKSRAAGAQPRRAAAKPRRVSGQTSPRQRPNFAPPGAQLRRASGRRSGAGPRLPRRGRRHR